VRQIEEEALEHLKHNATLKELYDESPEAYPYDPNLKIDALSGLERLRCIADRELAAHLFILFEQAQRNTQLATRSAAPRFDEVAEVLGVISAGFSQSRSGDLDDPEAKRDCGDLAQRVCRSFVASIV
jgi:hypothetical protein